MKALIIEDDENKRNQVVGVLLDKFPEMEVEISESVQSGLRKIISDAFSLILLDMTLPTFDVKPDEEGGRINHYGGREILSQMRRRHINMPVIVLTQFDRFGEEAEGLTLSELDEQLKRAYSNIYRGSIFYDLSTETWKPQLTKKILEITTQVE